MRSWGRAGSSPAGATTFFISSLFVTFLFALALVLGTLPLAAATQAQAQGLDPGGSLPETGKKVNQLIYPTFGNPAIRERCSELVIEWDWRKSAAGAAQPSLAQVDDPCDWEVWATTSIAANVSNYDGSVPGMAEDPPAQWYGNNGPSYGTYADPVHTVVNARTLEVASVTRGPSARWPEIFSQAAFEVDHIAVEVPANIPLDLYDLHVRCVSGEVSPEFLVEDSQPHALQVIDGYGDDLKIVHITDTHVYGPETKNGLNLDFNSFELREGRPGTPDRLDLSFIGYPGFPMDKDGDGEGNEGAIYLQEEIQAINLIDPDFVVFTGDSVFAQKNFNTYPKDTWIWGDVDGDLGSEYRFEYTWWYDELQALNVPIFCVPGNHDSYCWDGHALEHDDGQEIWQDLFGPLYYSWDYGDMTFIAVNSMDWDKADLDGPEPFTPTDTNPILWAIATALYPELAQDYDDRNGFLVDFHNLFLPMKVLSPHKWHGQIRGGGDTWEWQPWPWGPDPGGDGFTGQLAWIENELAEAGSAGKNAMGAFIHHDPLRPAGEPPEAFDHAKQFGLLDVPAGEGEGSQALMYLARKYEVDFIASGHTHNDAINKVDWAPYGDSPGQVVSINTCGAEPPVDGDSLLLDKTSNDYGGYRLITVNDDALSGWGFAGAEGDPDSKWSIPGWSGLQVGAGAVNDYDLYRSNRPVLQWMEQDASDNPEYPRPPISDGEGAFNQALPLNEAGPFSDITCKVKNTLAGAGAVLNLFGCRLEFAMAYLDGGQYYAVQNGSILEQYDTDSGQRMVTVLADSAGGTTMPVRVHAAGTDTVKPVIDEARINGGASETDSLDVTLTLQAHDETAGLMDLRISNTRDFAGAEWLPCGDGQAITMPWRLQDGDAGRRRVFIQFRDAAMPGNVKTVRLVIRYLP